MAAPRSGDLNRRTLSQSPSQSLFQSSVTPIRRRRTRTAKATNLSTSAPATGNQAATQPALNSGEAVVHSFSQPNPLWLAVLLRLQQGSFLLTFALIAGTMVVYGWTVYIQQQWGQGYEKLEALKKQERQLISANEVLKNQMAQQAESPTAGLLLPDPNNAIFLAPAPQRPQVKPNSPLVPPSDSSSSNNRPLGY